jgi:amino acid permease
MAALVPSSAYDSISRNDSNSQSETTATSSTGFTSFVGFCFTINFIVGVGILGIPYAMVQAGFVYSIILLAVVCLVGWMTSWWILEALSRTHAILRHVEEKRALRESQEFYKEQARVIMSAEGGGHDHEKNLPNYYLDPARRVEVVDMFEIILGTKWKIFYKVCISLFIFGTIWSYASVFGTSLSSHVSIPFINAGNTCDLYAEGGSLNSGCNSLYTFYLAIFACIVVPLSCMDLKDQKVFQVFLSICRFAMIAMMLGTVIDQGITNKNSSGNFGNASLPSEVKTSGMIAFIPVAVFAQIYHHSISSITHHLENKKKAPYVFGAAMLCCTILYSILGVFVGSFFGMDIVESCIINWTKPGAPGPKAIATIIVLFPPFDILSAYPLNAITLANSLIDSKSNLPKRQITMFRVAIALFPIIGAALLHDLEAILKWIGSLAVLIGFVFPGILSISARKRCFELFVEGDRSTQTNRYIETVLESSPMIKGRVSRRTKRNESYDDTAEAYELAKRKVKRDMLRTPYTTIFSRKTVIYPTMLASTIVILLIIILTANPNLF